MDFYSSIVTILSEKKEDPFILEYISKIPKDLVLPVKSSDENVKDIKELLLDLFKFNLEYGSLDYLVHDDTYAWFPFIISYNWCRNVTMYQVNLINKKIGKLKVNRATDYSSHDVSGFIYLENRYSEFILPMKDYAPSYADESIWEADFSKIELRIEGETLILEINEDIYSKDNSGLKYNGRLLDPEDDEDSNYIWTFENFVKMEK